MKFLSLTLAFTLLITSLSPLSAVANSPSSNCENGECLEGIIGQLNDLNSLYRKQCLPKKDLTDAEILAYHQKHGIKEKCWRILTDIKKLEDEVEKHQARLESRLGCEGGGCQGNDSDDLNTQLANLQKVEEQITCTEPKKKAIRSKCGGDMKCALVASAMGIGGYLAEKMLPAKAKMPNCHLGDDSCATQLATGFLKAVYSLFEGAWGLLKAGGKYAKKKAGQFWNWVTEADNHASTSQLALAKASEEGVLDMLINDFPGTMTKVFEGLVAALKEWFKADILCQKWEGVPHFGKCLQPTESIDCVSCKAMVNGVCAISGTIIAEVVPAFLTGGLVTAAKHGVNGASKIAKLFRVSDKTMDALKASRAAKLGVQTVTKADDVLRISKGLKAAKVAIQSALAAIKTYLLSPVRKSIKSSLRALTELSKKSGAHVAVSAAGKVLVFSGKALKTTGKVILYPVENPMTAWAFKSGQRSFDKIFKYASPKLAKTTGVTSVITKVDAGVEKTLARIEEAKLRPKPNEKKLLKLEEQLLKRVAPKRLSMLEEILTQEKPDFDEIIQHLYPELQYNALSKKIGGKKVLEAERELLEELSKMPNGEAKDELLRRFREHVKSGEAKNKVIGNLKLRPEDSFPNLKDVVVPEIKPSTLAKMMSQENYAEIIIAAPVKERRSTAKALKVLENGGHSPGDAVATYKKFQKNFKQVIELAPDDSDAAGILAEFIRRERKAGLADDAIMKKLDDAFNAACD